MDFKIFPRGLYFICFFTVITVLFFLFGWHESIASWIDLSSLKVVGIVSSLIGGAVLASIFFILLRPRVDIGKNIGLRKDKDTSKEYYSFKFINTSVFSAFDVKVEAYVCYEIGATENGMGMNVKTKKVALRRSEWIYLARWRPVFEKTRHAPHCIVCNTKLEINDKENYVEDIKTAIESNSNYVEFRVTLKHSFSNLSSTYRKRFNTSDCVKNGKFKFGNELKIT